MNLIRFVLILTLSSILLISCSKNSGGGGGGDTGTNNQSPSSTQAAAVDMPRILNADSEPGQWLSYGRTFDEQRFSPLDEITTGNVNQLGLDWYVDYDSNLQQQGTPLYIDGVIYVSIARTQIYAFDASTGEQLWMYDPQTPARWTPKICCGIVNRGIAAHNGKIYLATLDGYLVALDAATGEEVWRTLTIDQDKNYSITSAPRIAKGLVFIGNSGGEFGVRGYIGAYDAETGAEVWRFYTVPGNPADEFENPQMEMAATTWGGEWWNIGGGGGTVWDAIVYDEQNDLLIFGTGNGSPWNQQFRDPSGGDNLFLASIIAVNPDTGEYVWHYQTTPGDAWDYDAVPPMTLANLAIEGLERRVVMQPCKNGFMYVLDAATGELLKADPFTTVNWADGIDMDTGRPIEVAGARYPSGTTFNLAPGVQGAHGWHANAYDPNTGLLYIATQDAYFPMKSAAAFLYDAVNFNLAVDFAGGFAFYQANPAAPRGFVGFVQAWDPVLGGEVWRGDENQGPTGGALVTAGGLVFQGGGGANEFRAYHALTGEKLWEMDVQTASLAPPISYELDGRQYIAVSVGGNSARDYFEPNYSRLLVFSLGANAQLPPRAPYTPRTLNPPPPIGGAQEVAAGEEDYNQYCAICHGANGNVRLNAFPNLLVSPLLNSQSEFDQVVLEGARSGQGMPSFADRLLSVDSFEIRAYLIALANERLDAQQ